MSFFLLFFVFSLFFLSSFVHRCSICRTVGVKGLKWVISRGGAKMVANSKWLQQMAQGKANLSPPPPFVLTITLMQGKKLDLS